MTKQPTRNGSVGHIRRILHLVRAALVVLLFSVFARTYIYICTKLSLNRLKTALLALFLLLPMLSVFLYTRAGEPAYAATSSTLNYQMRLLNSSGGIVTDGNYHVEFKLYTAANSTGSSQGSCAGDSNCVWVETRTTGNLVRVVNGYMSVNLGSVTAFGGTINWDQEHWLGVRIGGAGGGASWETIELTSDGTASGNKIKLTAVPYALRAGGLQATSGSNELKVNLATPTADVTYTFADAAAGSYTVCSTASVCTGYQASPASGSYLQQVPTSTATNTITPTTNSVVALTVNGTSGTAATAVNIIQGGAATGLALTSSNTGTGQSISLTNTSGTQAAGLVIDRNGVGGTTTDLLRLQNTAGTATNGLTFSGTFTNLISASNFTLSNGGALTAASTGEFQGASVTVGTTSQSGSLILNDGSSNTGTISLAALGQNTIFTIPDPGAGTASFCLTTGNCNGLGDILQGGNSYTANVVIGTNDAYALQFETQNNVQATIAVGGATIFKNSTDSTAAFQVQNAASTDIFKVDSTNSISSFRGKNSVATLGSEKVTNGTFTGNATGWTLGTGWAYNSNNVIHTPGNTADLEQNVSALSGEIYLVSFTVGGLTTGGLSVSVGGAGSVTFIENGTFETVLEAINTDNLKFSPSTDFNGTLDNISVKRISTTNPVISVNNSDGTVGLEIRSGGSGQYNSFIGQNSGISNSSGLSNSGYGYQSLYSNTSGNGNSSLGWSSLFSNTTGSENSAFGSQSLIVNVDGDANTAIGFQALSSNVNGSNNVAVGAYTLMNNQVGSLNTALGYASGAADSTDEFEQMYNIQNATTIGAYSVAQASNSLILGGAGADAVNVGIGTTAPTDLFSISPVYYSTGTAYQSGTTITGVGTTWTSAMVGMEFIFATGEKATITVFGSTTSLTASVSQTVSSNPGIAYRIHNRNFYVTNTGSAALRSSTNSTTAFQIQDATGDAIFKVDTTNDEIEIGVASDTTGKIVLYNATNSNTATIQSGVTTTSYTLTLPTALPGSTQCLQSDSSGNLSFTSCAATPPSGSYLVQVPTATADNTVTPTANSVVGLTVNGTSGTAATAVNIVQAGAALGLGITSSNTGDGQNINLTNTSGTQTNGLLINRNGGGGTTTNLLNLTNTAGTATNAISLNGTFTNLINSTNFTVTNAGAITANSTYNTNTFTSSALQFGAASAATIQSASGQDLTVDSGTTGALNIGTGANAKTITIGNVSGATSLVLNAGTGNIDIGTTAQARATNIATGAAAQTVTLGSTNTTSSLTLQSGSGDLTINSTDAVLIDSAGLLELNSSGGAISIGNDAVAQAINVGTGAAARTITIGNVTGATALNLSVGTGNFTLDGVAGTTYTIGSSTTTGTITIGGTAQTGTTTLGSSSGTNTVAIGAGTGATTVNISNGNAGGAVNIGAGFTTGTITIGGTGAQTGNIDIGTGTGAQALNFGTGGTGAKTVTVGSTASTSATTIQGGTGAVNVQNQGTGAVSIANNAVNSVVNIGKTGSTGNTTTVNLATSTGAAQTIYIGGTGGAGANSNASTTVTAQGGTTSFNVASAGTTVRTFTDTTTAFQVQNAAATALFNVDSSNTQINLVKSIFSGNILPGSSSSAYTTTVSDTTIDSTSSTTGNGTSVAISNDGLPSIAYSFNDGSTQQLRFLKCANASCTSNTQVVADSTSGTGNDPSMVIDTLGKPWIAHYNSSGTHLRITQCGNSTCSSGNTSTNIDSTNSVGQNPDIAIGSDGYPIISYRDTTNTALKFADYVGSGGTGCADSAWTCTAITNSSDFGDESEVALGSDGAPIIAYHDNASGDLEFARYVGSGGTGCATAAWNCTTLDSANNVADSIDLAIGSNGYPIIAYRDITATDAVVYACSNISCSSGTKTALETSGNTGQYITMAIAQDGKPIVGYSTSTGTLRTTKCATATCDPNTSNTSTQLNASANVGNFNSVIIPADGLPFIGHYDVSATNLLGYKCASTSCSGTTTGYTQGIDIGASNSVFNNGYIQNIRTSDATRPFTVSTNNIERLTISGADGSTTVKSDSTSAFSVQDTSGNLGLRVDTTNLRIGIGTSAPSYTVGLGEGADRTIGVETRASNAAGRALTISAGAAGAGGSAFQGGNLTLQGGAAAGTGNAVGGSVTITGGAGVGTGVQGLVNIYPATFTSSGSTQSFGTSGSITGVDSYSSVAVNATAASLIVTLPSPNSSNQVVGRIMYVTAVDNSNDFTLRLGGTLIDIAMKENSTATLIWNGTGWTAAGASSSTDLQSAYNNTLTSAGGAELVLNPSGGAADGLTIRNNGTTPIIGGIFEAQTAIGSNLFSVNNNATEYANNGGGESSTFTMWTGTPTGGTIARTTTAANIATGQAATSVTTTATIGHGVENTLSTTLTNSLRYQVSFAIKADSAYSAFSTLDVMYSYDGTALRHCVAGTPYYSTGTASQSGTTITGSGTTFTSAMVGKTFVFANGSSTVISGYTSATQLTAATSQTVSTVQNFGVYDAGYSVKSSVWSRVTCFFTAPANGTTITASNSVMIRQTDATARIFYVDNLSVTVSADVNHAVDGSVDDSTNFATNWSAFDGDGGGAGTSATARDTSVIYDTSASARADTSNHANMGLRNNMTITPAASTQYLVSFYARSGTGSINDLTVRYSEDGGTNFVSCVDYNTQAITTSAWTKITCLFTSDGSVPGSPNPDLVFTQNTAPGGTRSIYIDALSITLNNNNSSNIQIGGANKGGPITLLTLDRSSNAPIAANNDAYLGSMYYDTTTGRIQCYEADGWGACGSAPDNYVNLNPEYAGAVLNGTGIGTMTADFCANQSGVLQVNYSAATDPCYTAGDVRNYYKWTSPQATQQTYSIYVTYQLPATFKGFSSDDTVQLVARADSTTNAAVTYQMFRSENGVLTQCGSSETTVVTSTNTWQSVGINGNESTSCNFSTSSANAFLIFKINMKANSNANAYVSTLSFTTTGR